MKKFGVFILGLFAIFIACNFTQAKDYEYTNLDITANILEDGTINVIEDFTANFFVNKHGIIRDIPLNYSVGGKDFHIEISNIYVQGKTFKTSKNNGNIEIKIGDADRTVIGNQNYPISYSTYGLIRNFSGMGYAELYWNLVGYDFDTNINKVRTELILPKIYTGFTADDFLITTDGKSKTIDGFEGTVDWSRGNRIIITYNKGLSAYHGITLAIKFPNNYFQFDHDRQSKLSGYIGSKSAIKKNSDQLSKNKDLTTIIVGLFFFVWILAVVVGIIRTKKSKQINLNQGKLKGVFAEKYPVIIQYNPPKGLNSAEVGLLIHRGAKTKDLYSLMYERASKNYINIKYNDKSSISLLKKSQIEDKSPEYEKKFFNALMSKPEREIRKGSSILTVDIKINEILGDLEDYGNNQGWFTGNKKTTGFNTIGCLFVLLFFGGMPIIALISVKFAVIFFLIMWSIGFFGGMFGLFNKNLDLDDEGAKLIAHILGYRKFLATCDENKLRLFLQQDPLYFDKTLPYAIIFGLETELIEKFIPIMQEMNISPIRYDGDYALLSETISTTCSISSSYSSDSGFDSGSSFDSGGSSFDSGGGGGGGGGSSW